MAAVTLRLPFSGKLKVDVGVFYLLIVSANIFVLTLLYRGGLERYAISSLILAIVNSFFSGLFVKSLFDASYNRARNLIMLSVSFFVISCTLSPILTYEICKLLNITISLQFLLLLCIYLNSLSPFWSPKNYFKMLVICATAILLLYFIDVIKALIIVDTILLIYIAKEFRKGYRKTFRITSSYLSSLLVAGSINFAIHFTTLFTAIHMKHFGFSLFEVMVVMLPIFLPFASMFTFYNAVEDLTSNVLRGSMKDVVDTYERIRKTYVKLLMKCIAISPITAVLAYYLKFSPASVFILLYISLGFLSFSLKYLEVYYKSLVLKLWILYLVFYLITLSLDPFKFVLANFAFSVTTVVFSILKKDAREGVRNLCKSNLVYGWGT